jgi:Ca2+-binding RTX toxin-like protein
VGPGGDLLDLDDLLGFAGTNGGYEGGDPFAGGFLRFLQSGAHTLLQWDADGVAGSESAWSTRLTLLNVAASSITADNFVSRVIVGTAGNDALVGGLGNDTLKGLGGRDTLDGSLGRDILQGGSGGDLYLVDNVEDVVVESSGTAGALVLPGAGEVAAAGTADTVIASVNYSLARVDFVENLTLSGNASRASGNALANRITGNEGSDRLSGGGGGDTLDGGAGNDLVNGDGGNDVLVWGAGDRLNGGAGADTLRMKSGDLDLTAVSDAAIVGIEAVDLRRAGANALTLTRADVMALNGADTLTVLGDAGDAVNAIGFTRNGSVDGYKRFTSGAATLLVDTDITVS